MAGTIGRLRLTPDVSHIPYRPPPLPRDQSLLEENTEKNMATVVPTQQPTNGAQFTEPSKCLPSDVASCPD
jgi:hypothetical protein